MGLRRRLLIPAVCATASIAAGCSTAPPLYTQPGAEHQVVAQTAQVFREFCVGGNRGLVHFDSLDGISVTSDWSGVAGWPIKLVVLPGTHSLRLLMLAPATSIWSNWRGFTEVQHDFRGGTSYLIKYRRVAEDQMKVWIEEMPTQGDIAPSTVFCSQDSYQGPT